MTLTIPFTYTDLSHEAKEEMIDVVAQNLLDDAKLEGEDFLKREWHDPQPQTWEEAFVRMYSISGIMWSDYEAGENSERPSDNDWREWLDESLIEKAENLLYAAFKHMSVEVEI